MARFDITVTVEYNFEVEADSFEDAEKQGWDYEEWNYTAQVDEIRVEELEGDDD